jgi:hypothetical protein
LSTAGTDLRPLLLTIIPALVAVLISACASGNGSKDAGSDGGDGNTAQLSVETSCDAIQDIQSYRYFISLKLDAPVAEQPIETATPNPLSDIAGVLSDLFRDMQLDGAFVAPDRSQVQLRTGASEELEVRTIGDQSWIRVGATWQEQPAPPGEDVLLTPASVCADIVADLAPSLSSGSREEIAVEGIETVHYRLNRADLIGLPHLLGRSGQEGLPKEYAVDVWLEKDKRWPVRLEVSAADTNQQGQPVSLELFMSFSDINSDEIEIEPPPVSPAQTYER